MAQKALKYAAYPVFALTEFLHDKKVLDRSLGKILIALILVFVGAALPHYNQHLVPQFIVDAVAYTIHALGVAPFAEKALSFFD